MTVRTLFCSLEYLTLTYADKGLLLPSLIRTPCQEGNPSCDVPCVNYLRRCDLVSSREFHDGRIIKPI